MINVEFPIVRHVTVGIRVNSTAIVSYPDVVALFCEYERETFFSKVTY